MYFICLKYVSKCLKLSQGCRKMRMRYFSLTFIAIFFYFSDLYGKIIIYYPIQGSTVSSKNISIIGKVTNDIKNLTLKNVLCSEKKIISKRFFYVKVNLKSGINKIKILINNGKEKYFLNLKYSKNSKPSFFIHRFIELTKCELCHSKNLKVIKISKGNCTTGICHQNILKNKFVHGPVAIKNCIACHNPHGAKNRKLLIQTGKNLCFLCHKEKKIEFNKKFQHKPVSDGNCTLCHDPHGSPIKYQLKGKTINNFCYKCHKKKKFLGKKYVHGPVGVGNCLSCHDPHASNNKYLIKIPKNIKILCFKCHDKKRFVNGKYVHGPVGGGLCTKCHSPHCSNNKKLLKISMNQGELCFDCHNRFKIIEFKYVHGPVGAGLCLDCHDVHYSRYNKLLKEDNNHGKLCFKCHKDMISKIMFKKYIHKPVSEKCTLCHSAHSSPYKYQLIGDPKIDVCLKCHKQIERIVKTPHIKLHKIISNKGCKACHNPHASNFKYQLFDKPVNKLCIDCHVQFKRIKRGHPCERHPVKGKRNPLNRRKKFNCASCHNPHGSKYDYLLIDTMRDFKVCKRCHNY